MTCIYIHLVSLHMSIYNNYLYSDRYAWEDSSTPMIPWRSIHIGSETIKSWHSLGTMRPWNGKG